MDAIVHLEAALKHIDQQVINKEPIKQHIAAIKEHRRLLIDAVKRKLDEKRAKREVTT